MGCSFVASIQSSPILSSLTGIPPSLSSLSGGGWLDGLGGGADSVFGAGDDVMLFGTGAGEHAAEIIDDHHIMENLTLAAVAAGVAYGGYGLAAGAAAGGGGAAAGSTFGSAAAADAGIGGLVAGGAGSGAAAGAGTGMLTTGAIMQGGGGATAGGLGTGLSGVGLETAGGIGAAGTTAGGAATSMGGTSAAGMFGGSGAVGTGALGSGLSGIGLETGASLGGALGTGLSGTSSLGSAGASTGNWYDPLTSLFSSGSGGTGSNSSLWGTAANALGSYLQGNAAQEASQTQADSYVRAAQIAADAAKFRPVGVTTNFGKSNFGYDSNGILNSAGYTLSPQLQAQQDQLMAASGGLMSQFTGSQAATAPMGQAAQSAMTIGNGYLGTSPQDQAAKYMAEQQALLAPSREREMAQLQAQMQAQGRGGFAMGATSGGYGASSPEMEALFNARNQQDLQLAAQATQGGMDYTKFGMSTVGLGGTMLSDMYKTQSGAYAPYQTALAGAQTMEGMGQNAMALGIDLGAKGQAAGTTQGQMLQSGMNNAAQSQYAANSYSPWAAPLNSAGTMLSGYRFDPNTGARL